ncbi:hypothetical protein ACWFNE_21195 [Cellulomonas sp. NPDC055163]
MTTTPSASRALTAPRVLTALASGLTTTAWYAMPDVLASRTARGWAKAGIAAVAVAIGLPELRPELAKLRAAAASASAAGVPAPTEPCVSADGAHGTAGTPAAAGSQRTEGTVGAEGAEPERSASPAFRVRVVASGVVAVAVVGSVAGTVAAERWLFRRGEARAAAGVRFAHTRAAAVLGALTVALALVPPPSDDEDTGGPGAGRA